MIIPRSEHSISRANISNGALKVLYTLRDAGYEAYLVGGGVRDLLLGIQPKDFDVATDAHPEEIKRLFRSCRLIGRRFRLAHVRIGREIIEVATFRGRGAEEEDASEDWESVDGRIVRDNVYGTLEEDAWRRDFSVNALYYDIKDFSVVDYTGGMEDLKARTLRLIGDPDVRYQEDPVRVLRALRFAAKLDLRIDRETERPIDEYAPKLAEIPPSRLYEEVLKVFMTGHGRASFEVLERYRLLEYLFPETAAALEDDESDAARRLIVRALENTDARLAEDKPVTPGFLFAAILWEPVRHDAAAREASGMGQLQAFELAGSDVIARQAEHVSLPRRFSQMAREIWSLQPRLETLRTKRAMQVITRPRFRAAYDFLVLRAESGEGVKEAAEWWTRLQQSDDGAREALFAGNKRGGGGGGSGRRRRRRRGKRRPAQPAQHSS